MAKAFAVVRERDEMRIRAENVMRQRQLDADNAAAILAMEKKRNTEEKALMRIYMGFAVIAIAICAGFVLYSTRVYR